MTEKAKEFHGSLCLYLAVLVSFFYPIAASLIAFFGLPSTQVNVGIRLLWMVIALYLISRNPSKLIFNFSSFCLFGFWLVYSFRILYDTSNGVRFGSYSNVTVYGFAFGNILIPLIAIYCWRLYLPIEKIIGYLFKMLIVADISILLLLVKENQGFSLEILARRSDILDHEGTGNLINPILISFYGEILSIVSVYLMLYSTKNILILWGTLFLGILLMFLGSSRGPLIGFILVLLFLLFNHGRIKAFSFKYYFKLMASLLILPVIFVHVFNLYFEVEQFDIFRRLLLFYEDRQNNEEEYRDLLYQAAWNDFLSNPIIGNKFVCSLDSFYPHNILLEVLMATGIIGGILFLIFLLKVLYNSILILKTKQNSYLFVVMVYAPIFFANMFSGSLFQSTDFWIIGMLLFIFSIKSENFKVHVIK